MKDTKRRNAQMTINLNKAKEGLKKVPLTADETAIANGGVLFTNFDLDQYEVIDDFTGKVVARFPKYQEDAAILLAKKLGIEDRFVSDTYIQELRWEYERYKFFHPDAE